MPGDLGTVFEVCAVAADCQTGTPVATALGGEMNLPFGVSAYAAGTVYVSDQSNQRIQKFAADPPPPPAATPTAPAPQQLAKKCKKGFKLKKGKCVKKKKRKKRS